MPHALVDLVAARPNAGSNGREEIGGGHSQPLDPANCLAGHTGNRSAPSGVHGRDKGSIAIGYQNRHAIGDSDSDRARRIGRDQGIRLDSDRWASRLNDVYRAVMNLLHEHQAIAIDIEEGGQPRFVFGGPRTSECDVAGGENVLRERRKLQTAQAAAGGRIDPAELRVN